MKKEHLTKTKLAMQLGISEHRLTHGGQLPSRVPNRKIRRKLAQVSARLERKKVKRGRH